MKADTSTLPNDPSELQSLVLALQQKNAALNAVNDQLETRLDNLESELRLYRIKRFQSQSEKAKALLEDLNAEQGEIFPDSLSEILKELGLSSQDNTEDAATPIEVKPHTRKPRKSRELDPKLPRVDVTYELDDKQCDHCGETMTCIGEESPLQQLAIAPAKQFVIRHIRKKYACSCKHCVKRAPMPQQPIPKSQASAQLLAFLMVSKFIDGLPLYRLERILARYGMDLSRQNMARWFIQASAHFDRILQAFEAVIPTYDIASADETRLQVLNEPGRTSKQKSWLWIRRGGPPDRSVILVDYDSSRSGDVPRRLLEPFKNGYLVVDAYAGYKQVAKDNHLCIVGCHDHARRKFKEAYDSLSVKSRQTRGGIAKQALKRYQALYAIEKTLKDKDPETKYKIRQEQSLPLLKSFHDWLTKVKDLGVAHEKTSTAVNYFLNQYGPLTQYCEDGRLPISNILSEHVAKSIAIARKNFLFANTQSGAYAAGKIYSVVLTAAQHEHEPIQYLTMLMSKLPGIKGNESIEHLLPWNVSKEQVKTYVDSLPSI